MAGRVRSRGGAAVRAVRDAHGEGVLLGSHRLSTHLPAGAVDGQELRLAIRPEHVSLTPRADGAAPGLMSGVVEEATFLGNINDYFVTLDQGVRLRVQTHPNQVFEASQPVYVEVDAPRCAVVE
jgi:ABC-type Fe3+/spermidine/putrescine transport system ATPase subunit